MGKVNMPVRTAKTSKKYRQNYQTTLGYMQFDPIFSREHIPNRKSIVDYNSLVYADPLTVPVFGAVEFHQHTIFVPYRCVWPFWDSAITETIGIDNNGNSIRPTKVPFFSNLNLLQLFTSSSYNYFTAGTSSQYDYDILDQQGNHQYYLMTDLGIHTMSLLRALHYKVNLNMCDYSNKSALPLLCAAKAYLDWFYPSSYVGAAGYARLMALFEKRYNMYNLTIQDLDDIFTVCYRTCYDEDQVTSVWDNPIAPNNLSTFVNTHIPDVTNNASQYNLPQNGSVDNFKPSDRTPTAPGYYPTNGTPAIFGGENTASTVTTTHGVITQYLISALHSLNDFTLIHKLAGIREIDRYLAEYGINLKSEILKRSMKISTNKFVMEFNQVLSYADTSSSGGTVLGGYAGKGAAFNGNSFEFINDEFGQLIVINTIVPQIDYYQGQHREIMHLDVADFYHPKFDHMGVQAKSAYEVYVPDFQAGGTTGGTSTLNQDLFDKIFGYVPRYSEYNEPASEQGGLFISNTRKGLLPLYSLWRDLQSYQTNLTNLVHGVQYVKGNDADQYNRIFSSKNKFPFTCFFRFNVENYDTTLPLYDTFDFKEEKGDSSITVEVNGSKLN